MCQCAGIIIIIIIIIIIKQLVTLHLATYFGYISHLQKSLVKYKAVKGSKNVRNIKYRMSILECFLLHV
jgi:hypothetical protein